MKKIIVVLFCLTVVCLFLNNKPEVLIPKESIRFRIIANDNTKESQSKKWELSAKIIPEIVEVMNNSANIDEARSNITQNLPNIEKALQGTNHNISFANNYFPEKKYKGVTYAEGEYESLVITLGEGLGDNWWCVMFPPLCLLEAKESEIDNVEYRSYIKDIINKFK